MGDTDGISVSRPCVRKSRGAYKKCIKRETTLFKRGKHCETCGTTKNLTVHNHNLSKEKWEVHCRKCHNKIHGIVWVPFKQPPLQGWYEEPLDS